VLDEITPLIISYNEAPNLPRTLARLRWARRIVLIDSGSTDETVAIARDHPQVVVVEHPFTDFASQCNFGLQQITTPWVLSLDADYELSDELIDELASLKLADGPVGYQARFIYRIHGRPLRGSLYPPRIVLHRREIATYRNEGHGHRVVLSGEIRQLRGVIYHDDRKPLARWFEAQRRYVRTEADYLLASDPDTLRSTDKIRLMSWPAPLAVFLHTLFIRRGILDGWPGWYYALQRLIAEALLALELTDRRLSGAKSSDRSEPTGTA
jgi:glycosyltransferase involved in cell wall biosynthesis